ALTNSLDFTIGYTAMSLPNVAQAASQIDPQLGSNLSDPLVGELRPSFVLTETNYWLSGFSYGLQYRY
ncbi:MAG: BBP7 family outer membrane beta-barrel protein, partial [bacterium]